MTSPIALKPMCCAEGYIIYSLSVFINKYTYCNHFGYFDIPYTRSKLICLKYNEKTVFAELYVEVNAGGRRLENDSIMLPKLLINHLNIPFETKETVTINITPVMI